MHEGMNLKLQGEGNLKNWIKTLKEMGTCGNALAWCKGYKSLAEAWADCQRGDWMLWLLGELSDKPESVSHKKLVLVACQCARLALPYAKEGELRPLRAIEVTEAWARGDEGIRREDVRKAADAAYAAAHAAAYASVYAAYAAADAADAAYAAADAAYAAAHATYAAAHAADAADAATYAAAHAAYAAAYAAYAAATSRISTLEKCADIVRDYYPVAPKLEDK